MNPRTAELHKRGERERERKKTQARRREREPRGQAAPGPVIRL